jgi:hypothetical protein
MLIDKSDEKCIMQGCRENGNKSHPSRYRSY